MNYLSVCSGVEAASLAWESLGWNPVAFSEIEPFPSAVLAHHWPDVPNLGDMTKYNEWKIESDTIDLLVGGTPCQAFSVAGLREGLKDPRGNLTLTFLGMVEKFRPRWVVWENVPGVLSDRTNAFGQFLSGLGELGYEYAYRVLDAQHFGVPQRRRRVFVVASIGSQHPAKVLFEPESLCGDLTPSREAREEAASYIAGSFGGYREGVGTLRAAGGDFGGDFGGGSESLVVTCSNFAYFDKQRLGEYGEGQVSSTLAARDFKDATDLVVTTGDLHAVAFSQNQRDEVREMDLVGALAANPGMKQQSFIRDKSIVRRLTPLECERLQGFPDNHTRIPWRGKPEEDCPDGPRYKACGNSMAVPVMRWIGERIQEVENAE